MPLKYRKDLIHELHDAGYTSKGLMNLGISYGEQNRIKAGGNTSPEMVDIICRILKCHRNSVVVSDNPQKIVKRAPVLDTVTPVIEPDLKPAEEPKKKPRKYQYVTYLIDIDVIPVLLVMREDEKVEDILKEAGISSATITRIMTGQRVKPMTVNKLAEFIECDIFDIATEIITTKG